MSPTTLEVRRAVDAWRVAQSGWARTPAGVVALVRRMLGKEG